MEEKIILVDRQDNPIGTMPKLLAINREDYTAHSRFLFLIPRENYLFNSVLLINITLRVNGQIAAVAILALTKTH